MDRKKDDKEKSLDYLYGYRDGLEDVWEEVLKMATKGYNSQEMQIFVKSRSYSSKKKIDDEIIKVEAVQKGIEPVVEELPPMPIDAEPEIAIVKELKPGLSYLVKEPKPSKIFEVFEKNVQSGKPGLCIIRMSPIQVKEKYDLGMAKIIWLTKSEKTPENLPPSAIGLASLPAGHDDLEEEYIDPSAGLPILFSRIVNFLDGHDGAVVLLEGVEYMISHNKFSSVMGFIQKMNEHVVTSGANLILAINPQAIQPIEFSSGRRPV